jgi:hypothetical protein
MRPMRSERTGVANRRAWEAPTVTKLAIGTETKTPLTKGQGEEPAQPAAPASKLGFSLEMGFPLSARTDG